MQFKGSIPPEIIQSIKSNKCILFVGAGLSAKVERSTKVNLPLWGAFLQELVVWAKSKNTLFWNGADEIENIIKKGNYLLAAQELQECVNLGEFAEFLNQVFRDKNVIPTATHKNIFKIPFRAILTTNYDTLIEGAYTLTNEGKVPVKFVQEDLKTITSPLRSEDFFIFKIHGDIDRPDSIILGSRGYNQLLFRTPEYLHFLETLFTTHTVLFVGFNGSDVDLDFVMDRLSTIYSRTLNKHYILLPNNKYNLTEKRRLLLDRRLEVIEYEEDNSHSQVDYFFDSLDRILNPGEEYNSRPKSLPTKSIPPRFLIISSKETHNKYHITLGQAINSMIANASYSWFYGLDSMENLPTLNTLIENANIVIIFFDKNVLKKKEIESLFELLTLREIDKKVRLVPIAVGADPTTTPKFLLSRLVFMEENLTAKNLKDIIKHFIDL